MYLPFVEVPDIIDATFLQAEWPCPALCILECAWVDLL